MTSCAASCSGLPPANGLWPGRGSPARERRVARALGLTDGEAIALWDLACHTSAGQHIDAALLAAGGAGAQALTQDLQVLRAAVLLLDGQPDAAESLLVRFGHRVRLGEPVAAPWVTVSEALLHLHRGELTAARRALHGPASATEASRTEYRVADRAAALGWLAWEEGRWADALRISAGPVKPDRSR